MPMTPQPPTEDVSGPPASAPPPREQLILDLLMRLDVRLVGGGTDEIVVTLPMELIEGATGRNRFKPNQFHLEEGDKGWWRHAPSGTIAPLGEQLAAIADLWVPY